MQLVKKNSESNLRFIKGDENLDRSLNNQYVVTFENQMNLFHNTQNIPLNFFDYN